MVKYIKIFAVTAVMWVALLVPTIKSYAIDIDALAPNEVEMMRDFEEQWGLSSNYYNDFVGFGDYLYGLRQLQDYRDFLFLIQDNINTGIFYYHTTSLNKVSYSDVEYVTVRVTSNYFYVGINYDGKTDSYTIPVSENPLWFDIDIVASNDSFTTGFNEGKKAGYAEGLEYGEAIGRNKGFNDGVASVNDYSFTGLLFQIFTGIGSLFAIELLPNITIGALVAIPLVFGIIYFILGKRGSE
ncbi:MAG: hypothetical protein QXI16_05185 [Sulfolobaceae archaeon]